MSSTFKLYLSCNTLVLQFIYILIYCVNVQNICFKLQLSITGNGLKHKAPQYHTSLPYTQYLKLYLLVEVVIPL